LAKYSPCQAAPGAGTGDGAGVGVVGRRVDALVGARVGAPVDARVGALVDARVGALVDARVGAGVGVGGTVPVALTVGEIVSVAEGTGLGTLGTPVTMANGSAGSVREGVQVARAGRSLGRTTVGLGGGN